MKLSSVVNKWKKILIGISGQSNWMSNLQQEHRNRRHFGQHFTSIDIFQQYIFPEIKEQLWNFLWVDLFAGSGNLVLSILDHIPLEQRIPFFQDHIRLFDIQDHCIQEAIENAKNYGIPPKIAQKYIRLQDTIKDHPAEQLTSSFPIFHITNPPYLYVGYIMKTQETTHLRPLFTEENEGYQDLYQLAMMNDLRKNIKNMIYIIPSNFLFGNSVSNKIRRDFFPYYGIKKAMIFESKIFEHTGTNVMITFFERKPKTMQKNAPIEFRAIKIRIKSLAVHEEKNYRLTADQNYKAGNEFEEFIQNVRVTNPIILKYYLKLAEVQGNKGKTSLSVIDANDFQKAAYQKRIIYVNSKLAAKIRANPLWIRTVDTGTPNGRVGLYRISDSFGVEGILVTKATYRTNPIQIFFEPLMPLDDQASLLEYVNLLMEILRKRTDSEFMTTYKFSTSHYTRKYFGLSQARKLMQTFPYYDLLPRDQKIFRKILEEKNGTALWDFMNNRKH
ncbi:MAG: N-6 DNA methylase [Promethearchaeota archaeon]